MDKHQKATIETSFTRRRFLDCSKSLIQRMAARKDGIPTDFIYQDVFHVWGVSVKFTFKIIAHPIFAERMSPWNRKKNRSVGTWVLLASKFLSTFGNGTAKKASGEARQFSPASFLRNLRFKMTIYFWQSGPSCEIGEFEWPKYAYLAARLGNSCLSVAGFF